MTNSSVSLHELRRRIYVKAKAQTSWRFWGLYVHVCKTETLREAYRLAKENNGAPGIDGVSFEAIEEQEGVVSFVEHLRKELIERTYRPLGVRKVGIPKDGGKTRVLSIPAIRDRVVQGALKLILEPIFEADFQPGSFGYRLMKSPHDAIQRVSDAIIQGKTHVIDLDLRAYFDTVRHHIVLEKVAKRVNDADVMHLLKMILKASGKLGVPQGGVISPLLSNLYLTEVDKMLERAKEVTRTGRWTAVEYARFADDLVILVDSHPRHRWLRKAVEKRLREELAKLQVEVNDEKSRRVDLTKGESFGFLGFVSPRAESCRTLDGVAYATDEKTHGAVAQTQRLVPSLSLPAYWGVDRKDQSHPTRLGELLRRRTLEPVLCVYSTLGSKEASETSGARPTAQRLRLEAMESAMVVRNSRTF